MPSGSPPRLWIVAGPNGSGKTTVAEDTDIDDFSRSVWIINPDRLAARLADSENLALADANAEALDRIDAWLYASILAYQTVGVETVLATSKYRNRVRMAKRRGFEVRLIYVLLGSVEQNISRVAARVRKGGHDVPEEAIRQRHTRSLAQLPWFIEQADYAYLFDNSGATPALVGQKIGAGANVIIDPAAPDDLKRALEPRDRDEA